MGCRLTSQRHSCLFLFNAITLILDVVPNATSRDEMGRAKVNDLLDFFVAKYGGEDTVEFQKARLNFIQSMAAYSVVCYILQIKDRHNGNIMIDGEGHIVHIGRLSYFPAFGTDR